MIGDVTVFAETNFRNQRRKFGIKRDDRRRHTYVVGKTGMGKSTLLENMIIADIRAGNGLAVVDPHGDLAEKILEYIPNNRVNDVIYFNPSDTQFPIAFNILESIGDDYKHLVAYGLVGVFKKIWADSWGPRMEYIMTNTILALLEYPGSTLLGLMRMLVDKAYRKKVVDKVTDPVVKTFWANEYANYSEKFRTEAIAPIQNKVGQFLASAIIRNIVGQSKSTIEMREIMDKKKILIMNLAKGRIGEENSALLGAMMITKLQIAAMSRVDIPEPDRVDFYLYVDEFQNFATDSFAGILSEARKYRLCLIMAHQYFEQLGDVVKAAVFGNVGTMIVFRVGAADAAELELEFAPQFLPADIVNLKKYTFCMRLMVDGVATEPFSGIGLPPATGATSNKDKIIKVSRERYARPQAMVEDRIIRWSGVDITRPDTVVPLNADGTTAPVDEGDDMNWPEPTWKVDPDGEANLDDDVAPVQSAAGVKMEAAQAAVITHVGAGFIPGDLGATPLAPQPTVQVATPPVVQLQAEPAVTIDATRPRISFINHRIAEAESQSTLTDASAESGSASDGEEDGEDYEDENDTTEETTTVPISTVTIPSPVTQAPVSPAIVTSVTAVTAQPTVPKTPVPSPVASAPSVSLQALKQGNVPSVKFTGTQSAGNPSNQSNNTGDPNKRKRKRKRNRGNGNSTTAVPSPVVSTPKPIQSNPIPSIQLQQPKAQPAPRPQPAAPSQPKPQTPANDPNKVAWGDILQ